MTAAVIPSVLPQLDLPGPLGDFCDQVGLTSVPCALAEVPDAATTAMEVVTDPFGSFVGALHGAARGLTTDVVPALVDMARPNLEQAWWVDAYRLAFGLAILVFAILVLWNLTQTSRGKMSGDQFVNSITFYAVMFFFGATFGPALGALLVTGFGRLTDNVVSADSVGLDSGINTITAKLESTVDAAGLGMVINGDLQKITGGSFVAAMMLFLMCIALILVFVVLIVQLVTLYLSGVLIPLSLVLDHQPEHTVQGLQAGRLVDRNAQRTGAGLLPLRGGLQSGRESHLDLRQASPTDPYGHGSGRDRTVHGYPGAVRPVGVRQGGPADFVAVSDTQGLDAFDRGPFGLGWRRRIAVVELVQAAGGRCE